MMMMILHFVPCWNLVVSKYEKGKLINIYFTFINEYYSEDFAGLSEKLPTIELWARLYTTFGSKTFHLGIWSPSYKAVALESFGGNILNVCI